MKYNTLVGAFVLILSQSAMATACPNLSGGWTGDRSFSPLILIAQNSCTELTMTTNGFTSELQTDGVLKPGVATATHRAGYSTQAEFAGDVLVVNYFSGSAPNYVNVVRETYRLTNSSRTLSKRWATLNSNGTEDEVVTGTFFRVK